MYREQVQEKLTQLLNETPPAERQAAMTACASAAGEHLNSEPSRESPEAFARTLFEDAGMISLVTKDEKNRLAMSAELPEELVTNLLPSDGHLD
jgi:hypothetical protein